MISRGDQKLAVGIDARTRGFDATGVLDAIARLRANAGLRVELVYAWADESTLQRRYTETRRRHPLAPQGMVADGIAAEIALTEPLREHADLVVDTSGLPIANLRRLIWYSMHASCETRITIPYCSRRPEWTRRSGPMSKPIPIFRYFSRASPN
jgi:RNase adaptor protein for sRNA GlmZ degradation